MLFNSLEFLLFLPAVLLAYHLAPGSLRKPILLAASYGFYAAWDARFLLLLVLSTLLDYGCARGMGGASPPRRKALLWLSVTVNLGVLATFKYFDFFLESLRALLQTIGLEALDSWALGLILPLGISFYTFQTMAYTIDVYRGRIEACTRLIDYAIFVAFFPQLVAGPIERAARLLPQIMTYRRPDTQMIRSGLTLMLLGLFKKVFVGDALLSPYVDRAFADPATHPAAFLLLGACLFSIQIYVDFSGYTDIARGVGRLLGIELMANFEQPYLSTNITDFWRRWHISLSTWLRDYLYIPLGGNRKGRARTYANLMTTMLLGGLWHGAGWTFVIWGGIHGTLLAAHRALRGDRGAREPTAVVTSVPALALLAASWLTTHLLVVIAWVFFRAADLDSALAYLHGMTGVLDSAGALTLAGLVLALDLAIVLMLDAPARWAGRHDATERLPGWARAPIHAALILCIWTAWPASRVPFIYFQF